MTIIHFPLSKEGQFLRWARIASVDDCALSVLLQCILAVDALAGVVSSAAPTTTVLC